MIEQWEMEGWDVLYSAMEYTPGSPGKYRTTIINRSVAGQGKELPTTGGRGSVPYMIVGLAIMLTTALGGCVLRRKRGRREG